MEFCKEFIVNLLVSYSAVYYLNCFSKGIG